MTEEKTITRDDVIAAAEAWADAASAEADAATRLGATVFARKMKSKPPEPPPSPRSTTSGRSGDPGQASCIRRHRDKSKNDD